MNPRQRVPCQRSQHRADTAHRLRESGSRLFHHRATQLVLMQGHLDLAEKDAWPTGEAWRHRRVRKEGMMKGKHKRTKVCIRSEERTKMMEAKGRQRLGEI